MPENLLCIEPTNQSEPKSRLLVCWNQAPATTTRLCCVVRNGSHNGADRASSKPEADSSQIPSSVEAGPPFNKASADLIIRTADDVNFHVWKCVLEEVSPFFADMFALGGQQPKATSSCEVENGGDQRTPPPCIDVSESSVVLRRLLLTIYPPSNFTFTSLDELKPVIGAAHKYQMDPVIDILRQVLVRDFAKVEPLRVFSIATLYDLPLAQEAAARCFLGLSATDAAEAYVDELRDIDAKAYHQLLACRRQCVADVAKIFEALSWFPDGVWVFTNNMNCNCGYESFASTFQGPDGTGVQRTIKRWFFAHFQRVAAALLDKPCPEALDSNLTLCDQTFKDATNCSTCRGMVHDHMRSFMKSLRGQVEERVSKITTTTFCPS
ncbi:hypothetical protein GSI_12654 [Ganoderma sinense ZZ0214-1]|uniref:BTB domain-containing protein n=1 Tax=Ganoderma sinense ZZ0214-1 TaxID=1077348 RepID=A0A2G8RTV5_9APHY|nr:hypothetical protein GSI_12654 [Ganoderma sinense ZZ0214-1]